VLKYNIKQHCEYFDDSDALFGISDSTLEKRQLKLNSFL